MHLVGPGAHCQCDTVTELQKNQLLFSHRPLYGMKLIKGQGRIVLKKINKRADFNKRVQGGIFFLK